MKTQMMKTATTTFSLACAAGLAVSASAVDVAFDDFDGTNNFSSRTFTPDNNAVNGLFNGGAASRFDRFGIVTRDTDDVGAIQLGLPFDVVDSSVTGQGSGAPFPADNFGVLKGGASNAVLLSDTVNGNNPNASGAVSAEWVFDVSGFENLNLSIDFAAIGEFEDGDDIFAFSAVIDGGTSEVTHNASVATDTFYSATMEGGENYIRYTNPFFGDPPSGNGPNDSPVAVDGGGEPEFNDYVSPVVINGTQLNNDFQTVSAPIAATGDTLTLSFQAIANGSLEYFLFDNVLITGDAVGGGLEGDYNSDGFVSQGDLDLVLLNWGDAVAPAGFEEDNIPGGGPFDSLMSQNELDGVLLNWGDGTPPTLAVPEPTAAALLGLGGLALLRRRSA